MANSNNVYGTAQPLQGNVSDWMLNQEQMDFAKRREDREIAAIDEARKAREQAKKDKLRQRFLDMIPNNYDTGSTSLNQFQAKIINKGVNRLGEISKELDNKNLDENKLIDLEIEAQNISRLPENLKVATDNFTAKIEDYRKGIADNVYFRDPDFENKVLSGFENYIGGLDENGFPVVAFADRNADGKIDNLDVIPYEGLMSGDTPWKFQKQFDLDALAKKTAEKIGYNEVQTDSRFENHLIKNPSLNALNSITDSLLVNPDGSPTEVALSELRKRGLQSNEAGINEIKNIFRNNVLAYTDTIDKTDVDYAAMNAANKEAREAKDKQEQTYSLDDLRKTGNLHGTPVNKKSEKTGDPRNIGSVYQGNVNITRKVGDGEEKFRGFEINNDGSVSVTVDKSVPIYNEDGKKTDDKITTQRYNSKNHADIVSFFANRFKDPETGEFINTLQELKDKLAGQQPAKTTSTPTTKKSAADYGL